MVMKNMEETRPNPDPSVMTTQQSDKAVECLREIIEARLNGYDKAIELLQQMTDRFPASVKCSISQLQELVDEKIEKLGSVTKEQFNSIATQFEERDTRSESKSKDDKVAIDAALSAQKESVDKQNTSNTLAVNKSEASFTKQVDEIGKRIDTVGKALEDKVTDIKERVTIVESRSSGKNEGISAIAAIILGAFVVVSSIASVTAVIISLTRH